MTRLWNDVILVDCRVGWWCLSFFVEDDYTCCTGRSARWLMRPTLAHKSLSHVEYVCSYLQVEVILARAFHAVLYFTASSNCLASVLCTLLVNFARHAVQFLASTSHMLLQMPELLIETFKLSLYHFFWPAAERFPLESSLIITIDIFLAVCCQISEPHVLPI